MRFIVVRLVQIFVYRKVNIRTHGQNGIMKLSQFKEKKFKHMLPVSVQQKSKTVQQLHQFKSNLELTEINMDAKSVCMFGTTDELTI